MHLFQINILIFIFDIFYLFRNRGYIFKKTVVYTVMVWYALHATVCMHVKHTITLYTTVFQLF